jgi:hypothetical protein
MRRCFRQAPLPQAVWKRRPIRHNLISVRFRRDIPITWKPAPARARPELGDPAASLRPVLVIDSATLPPEARLAVAEVSQTANGLRVKMHDKHGPLVSIGKHLGMFVDQVQVRARYAISDQPMSAEEWKKQYVKEG